jgi:hypothetical protein
LLMWFVVAKLMEAIKKRKIHFNGGID